ncbi:CarboxypepD_reg-like domain-containing protein [Flaviramulus basaltis]|uniref:CarboxypepD_reg-like domain-containing protein n=1 Tax=Flaviramulus basaltis TaxID=369401 RepID=A0A1K2ICJ2_9FLAO|nr:TonB-dependent receptor plug domain-containing protein [Flaviramulus basaltis]SFZ89435.1 CarboxypepD_reg-like domain-containing protein [Flaviramulus basaltis]
MKTRYFILISTFLLFLLSINAQEKNKDIEVITGTVIDSNNEPIKGVYVFIDSLKTKETTNKKGFYKIKPKSDTNFITVYSSKHGILTVDYSGEKEVNFIFSKNSKSLSEKELAKLGFKDPTIRKRSGIINFEGLQGINAFNTIYQMIEGRVSGVNVTGQSISIRGANTLERGRGISTEPLLLVNETTVTSISHIAPSDVKSIEVIKGPETAFYGSRGVYGVVKITLKD